MSALIERGVANLQAVTDSVDPHHAADPRVVGLVACSKSKKEHPAIPRTLYTGQLFLLARSWFFQSSIWNWGILSAKYGYMSSTWLRTVEPYDETLVGKNKEALETWGAQANRQLVEIYEEPSRVTQFVFIGGKSYQAALKGLQYTVPLEGLSLGQQKAALLKHMVILKTAKDAQWAKVNARVDPQPEEKANGK